MKEVNSNEDVYPAITVTHAQVHVATLSSNKDATKILASAKVVLSGQLQLTGLKVIRGINGLFVGYPSDADALGESEYHDVYYPLSPTLRAEIDAEVLSEYDKLANPKGTLEKPEEVVLEYVGLDDWCCPIWKVPNRRIYFGACDKLFTYKEVTDGMLQNVTEADIQYFGSSFNCEAHGGQPLSEKDVYATRGVDNEVRYIKVSLPTRWDRR